MEKFEIPAKIKFLAGASRVSNRGQIKVKFKDECLKYILL